MESNRAMKMIGKVILFTWLVTLVCFCSHKKDLEGSMANPVVYFEIPVSNLDRAIHFYSTVFSFTFEKTSLDGNEMALFPFVDGSSHISGALAKGKTYRPSKEGTLVYFQSEDITSTLKKVVSEGGFILYPRTRIEFGFVAEFQDSEGNRVALFEKEK
ncbi:glyoxalase/bleomycin resistance protein/dioxygenase [Leptospira ryugenii]|uniref:Glyoxalase/bleomycin resistance protein/dioxygenase n=1 Tax=Leptospira ryugenii TaxID=1917863 RepID=A0A2P2E281_9LEPT|nr:VOC family protein [Leptospira ryugenii]GBF50991.1 glyoxalase/bleomycin resistance protein/dioxygenase [Leptospira ryugenii]